MDLHRLTRPDGPWLHLLVAPPADVSNAVRAVERKAPLRVAARVIRGTKAVTVPALFDECSAALQFPLYFGENWDAFRDCLLDLDWLEAQAYTLVVAGARHLLEKAPPDELRRLVEIVTEAVHFWNQAGGPHGPRPFHVVLHAVAGEEAGLLAHWKGLGVSLSRLA
jgi:hypothetical protein